MAVRYIERSTIGNAPIVISDPATDDALEYQATKQWENKAGGGGGSSDWSALNGRPYIEVTPNGPTDGGDYGPNTSGTTTGGLLEALLSLSSTGGKIYVKRGAYTWTSAYVYTPTDYIAVIFEPGCSITISAVNGTPTNIIDVAADSTGAGHHHIKWMGNGCTINTGAIAPGGGHWMGSNPNYVAGSPASYMVEVSGFRILNARGTVFGTGLTGLTANEKPEENNILWSISDIYVQPFSGINAIGGIRIQGMSFSTVKRCFADYSTVTTGDYSALFVTGNDSAGNVQFVDFIDCKSLGNGVSGQTLEVQGADNTTWQVVNQFIRFINCTFDSGGTSNKIPGQSGPYIDDNNGNSSSTSYIANVSFIGCNWVNCSIGYQSTSTYYGFIKYTGNGPDISQTLGLLGRAYGPVGSDVSYVAITVGSSPFTYSNNDGFPELITVTGGTVSSITINGMDTGMTSGVFLLESNYIMTITYSVAPTMNKQGVG